MEAVENAIKHFAVKDTVRTITDRYRRDFNYVLYWQLRATEVNAEQLRITLASNVVSL